MREFWEQHANAQAPLEEWYSVVRKVKWEKFSEVRATYRAADAVNQFVVFDVGGNKFRLIAFIDYQRAKLFVRSVLTHKGYDKGAWKNDEFGQQPRPGRKLSNGKRTS